MRACKTGRLFLTGGGHGWPLVIMGPFSLVAYAVVMPLIEAVIIGSLAASTPRWSWIAELVKDDVWDANRLKCIAWYPFGWWLTVFIYKLKASGCTDNEPDWDLFCEDTKVAAFILASLPLLVPFRFYEDHFWALCIFNLFWHHGSEYILPWFSSLIADLPIQKWRLRQVWFLSLLLNANSLGW